VLGPSSGRHRLKGDSKSVSTPYFCDTVPLVRNITVSIPDEIYRAARVRAAEQKTRTATKIPAAWRSSQVVTPQNLLRARPGGRGIARWWLDSGS
jgi:hypothetical protein